MISGLEVKYAKFSDFIPMKVDLELDMLNDAQIVDLLKDREVACEFYAAMCNMRWLKREDSDDEEIVRRLKDDESRLWSCSWRSAGGVVSRIRNSTLGLDESYMDFYCSGNEGVVSERVLEHFTRLGWRPVPWD